MDTASVATDLLRIVEKLGQEKIQFAGFVSDSYFNSIYKLICVRTELQLRPWSIFCCDVPQ
jgi:hypothetical protein